MDRHANAANSGSSLLQCFYCTPQVEDVQDSKSRDKDQAREARIDLVVHCGHEQGSEVHMYQAPRGRLPDGSLKGQRSQGAIPAQEDLRICRRQYLDSTSPPACTACAKRENIQSFTPPPPFRATSIWAIFSSTRAFRAVLSESCPWPMPHYSGDGCLHIQPDLSPISTVIEKSAS